MWQVGPYFLNQGWNPGPLQWKCRVLTTGPPGKSLSFFISLCEMGEERDEVPWNKGEWGNQ